MKIDQFLIGLAVFAAFMLVGGLAISDVDKNYSDVSIDDAQFSGVFNVTDDIYSVSQGMKDSTFGKDITDDDALDSAIGGSISAVRQVSASFTLVGRIMGAISKEAAFIPPELITLGLAVLAIAIVFALVLLYLRITG